MSRIMRKALGKVIWHLSKKLQSFRYPCNSFGLFSKCGNCLILKNRKCMFLGQLQNNAWSYFFMTNPFFYLWTSVIARDKYRLWLGLTLLTSFIISCWTIPSYDFSGTEFTELSSCLSYTRKFFFNLITLKSTNTHQ